MEVLILEDESLVREHICEEVKKIIPDAIILACKSYADVERALENSHPTIALMDVNLHSGPSGSKGPDGIDAAKLVRQKSSAAIAFLTAFSDSTTLQRATAMDPDTYLTKPINPTQLSATIALLLKNKLSGKQMSGRPIQDLQNTTNLLAQYTVKIQARIPSEKIVDFVQQQGKIAEAFDLFFKNSTPEILSDLVDKLSS